jgi:hypothetical protein
MRRKRWGFYRLHARQRSRRSRRSFSLQHVFPKCISLSYASAVLAGVLMPPLAFAGPYAPAAGQTGSTAIPNTSPSFVAWATSAVTLTRGPQDVAAPAGPFASFGDASEAVGFAQGNYDQVVSLGDGGRITLAFAGGIRNGPGADFAVFENSINDTFLELAYVEVSSDGSNFFRFDSASVTPADSQVQSFGQVDTSNVDGLAGKYRQGFGTPFDLSSLAGRSGLDVNDVRYVRVIDVVGRVTAATDSSGSTFWSPSLDSSGRIINDPYNTPFETGGFDLDGVGVINAVPEPASLSCVAMAAAFFCRRARRRRSCAS